MIIQGVLKNKHFSIGNIFINQIYHWTRIYVIYRHV